MPHFPALLAINTHRPLPPLARLAFALGLVLLTWEDRRQSRRALGRLDPHLLRDIGLLAHAAEDEAARPFWKA